MSYTKICVCVHVTSIHTYTQTTPSYYQYNIYHIIKLKHTSARTYLLSRSILGKVSRTFCGSFNAEAVVASIHCTVKDLLSFQIRLFIVCRIESNDRPHFLSFHALCPKTAQLAPGMTMSVAIFFLFLRISN